MYQLILVYFFKLFNMLDFLNFICFVKATKSEEISHLANKQIFFVTFVTFQTFFYSMQQTFLVCLPVQESDLDKISPNNFFLPRKRQQFFGVIQDLDRNTEKSAVQGNIKIPLRIRFSFCALKMFWITSFYQILIYSEKHLPVACCNNIVNEYVG